MTLPNAARLPVDRVRRQRLADVVADQLRELILRGDLGDGERLPPLDRILAQFGVSAPTMREALRILEAEGLLTVQRGGIGGAIVRSPTANAAAYTLALVLRGQGVVKGDVSEAITVLEPLCTMLCARSADRVTSIVPALQRINGQARELLDGDGVGFNAKMLEFHHAVVGLSGNRTLPLLNQALEGILLADVRTWVAEKDAHGEYPSAEHRLKGLEAHDRIIELIAAGDGWAAAEAMGEHIERAISEAVIDATQSVDPRDVRSGGRAN